MTLFHEMLSVMFSELIICFIFHMLTESLRTLAGTSDPLLCPLPFQCWYILHIQASVK